MRIEAVNHSLDVLQGSRACCIALECGLELLLESLQPPVLKDRWSRIDGACAVIAIGRRINRCRCALRRVREVCCVIMAWRTCLLRTCARVQGVQAAWLGNYDQRTTPDAHVLVRMFTIARRPLAAQQEQGDQAHRSEQCQRRKHLFVDASHKQAPGAQSSNCRKAYKVKSASAIAEPDGAPGATRKVRSTSCVN